MNKESILEKVQSFDDRRDIVVPGGQFATLSFCIDHFIYHARKSINDHGYFAVALSGGSTPATIYRGLSEESHHKALDWSKVLLFWSDERSVPPTSSESNYHMAMESGLTKLPIPKNNIFRMHAEENIVANAEAYEKLIRERLSGGIFDMVMLGMGPDGHTASLFPQTHALNAKGRLVVANWVPQQNTWRMTLTFDCINQASSIVIYVLGKSKAKMLNDIFSQVGDLPAQHLGTSTHKALWILDEGAATDILPQ